MSAEGIASETTGMVLLTSGQLFCVGEMKSHFRRGFQLVALARLNLAKDYQGLRRGAQGLPQREPTAVSRAAQWESSAAWQRFGAPFGSGSKVWIQLEPCFAYKLPSKKRCKAAVSVTSCIAVLRASMGGCFHLMLLIRLVVDSFGAISSQGRRK